MVDVVGKVRTVRCLVGGLLVVGLLVGGGCAPLVSSSSFSATVYADGEPYAGLIPVVDDPEVYDARSRRIHLFAASNEVVSFRVELHAEGTVNARIEDFTSETGQRLGGNVELFQVHHVRVDEWPGWHVRRIPPPRRERYVADVLVSADAPRGGLPVPALAQRPVKLWFDVRVPRGTAPGRYTAPLDLLLDGHVADRFDVELMVWPFALPDESGCELLADVDHQALFAHHVRYEGKPCAPQRVLADHPASGELQRVLTDTLAMLRDHRLTPQLPNLQPVVKLDADANVKVDWTDYDRLVAGILDGDALLDRRPLRWWRIPLDEHFPEAPANASALSPVYARMLHAYLASAAEHFAERGWLDRAYVVVPFSEQMNAEAQAATRHYGYIAARAAPRLAVVSPLFPQDMTGYGWYGFSYEDLRDEVGIWAPAAQFFDRDAIARDLGAHAWLTVDRPPFSGTTAVSAPAADARVLAWQARVAGAEALRLGVINHWPEALAGREVNPQDCVAIDPEALIYPGRLFGLDQPVPSVRLKRLRRSMQDAAYLALLAERGRGHIAETIARSLSPYVGAETYGVNFVDGAKRAWEEDPRLWEMARRIMADELLGAGDRDAPSGDTLPTTLRWRRFMELTRLAEAQVTGVRVRPAGGRLDDGVEVVTTVTITNGGRVPIEGKLALENLPVGWTGVPGTRFLPRVEPGATRSVALGAVTGSLGWNTDGLQNLLVSCERNDGQRFMIEARLAHVAATTLPEAITLDGDPSEWPTGVGNDAAGFVPITGDARAVGLPGPLVPAHQTMCLVGQRAGKLYFAFRCETTPGSDADLLRPPVDAPADLVPTGAEAVEILLDPSNAGSPSTAQLYRIAVGPAGAIWQYGLATDPPTADGTAWAANIRHAVRVGADHWSAEVEVPLDAFPEAVRRRCVWGMNITRYDLESQEYSDWAGAVGNVYDPRTLGNLTLP